MAASVRNGSDAVRKLLCARLASDKYRSFARYNSKTERFEIIPSFEHYHNKRPHKIIRVTNSALSEPQELSIELKGASLNASGVDALSDEASSFIKDVINSARLQYAQALHDGIEELPISTQK